MKVSIITVVYNGEKYLKDCIESVLMQQNADIEYIVIDGASSDKSFQIAQHYKEKIAVLISEPDKGMYDALNKGITLAKGEVIGILNADDMLASPTVIAQVAQAFKAQSIDALYGNLNYVASDNIKKVQRRWRTKQVANNAMAWGWMPAHPTLYLRANVFKKIGNYCLDFGSAADYELMLRCIYRYSLHIFYLPILMVNMRNGGMSNAGVNNRYQAFKNDYKALKLHQVSSPVFVLVLKKLRKLIQFV